MTFFLPLSLSLFYTVYDLFVYEVARASGKTEQGRHAFANQHSPPFARAIRPPPSKEAISKVAGLRSDTSQFSAELLTQHLGRRNSQHFPPGGANAAPGAPTEKKEASTSSPGRKSCLVYRKTMNDLVECFNQSACWPFFAVVVSGQTQVTEFPPLHRTPSQSSPRTRNHRCWW